MANTTSSIAIAEITYEVLDEDRTEFYRFISEQLTESGIALIVQWVMDK
jgi:hypothetical protein